MPKKTGKTTALKLGQIFQSSSCLWHNLNRIVEVVFMGHCELTRVQQFEIKPPLEALIHFDSCRHLPVVVLAHFVQCFEQAFLLVRKRTFGSPAKPWSVSWLCNTFTKKLSNMCHHSGWTTSVQHVKPGFWPTWHHIMGGIAEETYLETAKLKIELVDLILTSSKYARIAVSFHDFYVQPECCRRWIPFDDTQLRNAEEIICNDDVSL